MDDFIRQAQRAAEQEQRLASAKQRQTYIAYIVIGVCSLVFIPMAYVLAPKLLSSIPKPGFLKSNEELVANFSKLEPGKSTEEVRALLGEPTQKDIQEANAWMVSLLADPGTNCSVTTPPSFHKSAPSTSASGSRINWAYGPYYGKINGQKSVGGSVLLTLKFTGDALTEATKFSVLSSIQDSSLGARR